MTAQVTKNKTARKSPVQMRGQATIEAILEATELLACEHGVESLKASSIARRAGVSAGTLYQYFGSLEAILAAWEERALAALGREFVACIQEAIGRNLPPDELLREAAAVGFDLTLGRMRRYHDRTRAELVSRTEGRNSIAEPYVAFLAAAIAGSRVPERLRRTDYRVVARIAIVTVMAVAYDVWTTDASEDELARTRVEVSEMVATYILKDAR